MSTFRIDRHRVDMDTGAVGVDRRGVFVVILLCIALFAGCFAIGRAASPRTRPGTQSYPVLPVAFAGAATPLRLSSAPPLQTPAVARAKKPTTRTSEGRPAAVAGARAITPVSTPTSPVAPRVQSPVREVARAPAPVQSPAPAAPAGERGGEGGKSQSHTSSGSGSGTSFDSSG